jgi:hypothetical protein
MRTWSEEVAEMRQTQKVQSGQRLSGYASQSLNSVVTSNPVQQTPNQQGITITPKAIILTLIIAGIGWYMWKKHKRET